MMELKKLWEYLSAWLLICTVTTACWAAPPSGDVEASIQRGISFLLTHQRPDGAIADRANESAMTALSIMAMASTGIMPTDPSPEGEAIRKALDYMLLDARHNEEGYFGQGDGSRMYGHGIITLMLTEMSGMGVNPEQDSRLRDKCQRGIDLILAAQKMPKSGDYQGGWRYAPNSHDSDLSVSVWQLLALRSAANDQFDVPPEAISQAVAYLDRSYTGQRDDNGLPKQDKAGFGYMPGDGNPSFAMTAAGTLAMQICGNYESPLLNTSEKWLLDNPPKANDRFFYYGIYYYAQALHQRGESVAEKAEQQVKNVLLPIQKENGRWEPSNGEENSAGHVYATAMAILSLSVRYHYLPIYQR